MNSISQFNFSNQSFLERFQQRLSKILDKAVGRNIFEEKFSVFVNKALSKDQHELSSLREILLKDPNIERIGIETSDGANLDGILIQGEAQPSKGVVFLVLGSGGCYESIANPDDLASDFVDFFKKDLGSNVDILVINFRGIGDSHGSPSYQGWVIDIYSGIKYLIDRGYDPDHTLLYGHSLGGWISIDAIKAISKEILDKEEKEIAVVSDRSFTNFADEAFYYVGGGIRGVVSYLAATFSKWNANVIESWKSMCARTLVVYSPDDHTIFPSVSLFENLRKKGHLNRDDRYFILYGGTEAHARKFTSQERIDLAKRLKEVMHLNP